MNVVIKEARTLAHEFRDFAIKGNVIDLAIGVIIGGAFGKIVDSLVKNIIMPVINVVMPAPETYNDLKLALAGKEIPYGLFLGDVLNFFIVAMTLFFFIVKFLGWVRHARRKEEAAAAPVVSLTKDQELLIEIRDLLKQTAPKPR